MSHKKLKNLKFLENCIKQDSTDEISLNQSLPFLLSITTTPFAPREP